MGYLSKLKRGLGLAFGAHFLHGFFMQIYNSLSSDKVPMSYLFYFSRYQTKYVIKFLFRQLMTSLTLRFIFNHPLEQWPRGEWEVVRNTKFEYLENKKSFLDEIKSIFQNYLRVIIWWKNEKELTQALSSFLIQILCNRMICNVTIPS